jgi:hypothetical protein
MEKKTTPAAARHGRGTAAVIGLALRKTSAQCTGPVSGLASAEAVDASEARRAFPDPFGVQWLSCGRLLADRCGGSAGFVKARVADRSPTGFPFNLPPLNESGRHLVHAARSVARRRRVPVCGASTAPAHPAPQGPTRSSSRRASATSRPSSRR